MSRVENEHNAVEVRRLLDGAARTIASVRYCWLVTMGETGANARPMGQVERGADDNLWRIRFLTDGRSRKASEIRRDGRVAIVFQHDPADAFVTLIGTATLCEDTAEVGRRWKRAYDTYFPTELDRANAAFMEVEVVRMELWIRGVTPEPFGLDKTVLERIAGGAWRLVRSDRKAA